MSFAQNSLKSSERAGHATGAAAEAIRRRCDEVNDHLSTSVGAGCGAYGG